MAQPAIRIGVSSCLLGQKVRFDGQHKRDDFLTGTLDPFVEWVPICPEVELGLGIPREPIRLLRHGETTRLVAQKSGSDHTEAMRAYASTRVAELAEEDLCGYVTKKGSPSCGLERVPVHGGQGGPPRRDGVGAFVQVLMEKLPMLPVEEEGRLHDPALRESFVVRIFAYARWKAMLASGMTRGRLVAFHTSYKLTLLSHSPAAYRRLGALVGGLGRGSIAGPVAGYGQGLMQALRTPATRGCHLNVLQHMTGYFRDQLDELDRKELEEVVSDYGRGLVPLVVPITLIRHHARRHGVGYLQSQVYLDPDPKELGLRNHV